MAHQSQSPKTSEPPLEMTPQGQEAWDAGLTISAPEEKTQLAIEHEVSRLVKLVEHLQAYESKLYEGNTPAAQRGVDTARTFLPVLLVELVALCHRIEHDISMKDTRDDPNNPEHTFSYYPGTSPDTFTYLPFGHLRVARASRQEIRDWYVAAGLPQEGEEKLTFISFTNNSQQFLKRNELMTFPSISYPSNSDLKSSLEIEPES